MPRASVREKLVETALQSFMAQGFNGCGVQDITDAAGVPKGSFYNHFKSKELLAVEVLDRYAKGTGTELLFDKAQPPLERLRSHFDLLATELERRDFTCGCLLGNFATELSDASPVIRGAMDALFHHWTEAVASCLTEAHESGLLATPHDPEALARFLVGAWEGAVARAKVGRTRAPLDDFFAIAFGTLLAETPAGQRRAVGC